MISGKNKTCFSIQSALICSNCAEEAPLHIGCTVEHGRRKRENNELQRNPMSIYQQLLYYYLSSDVYYEHFRQIFFWQYKHSGECADPNLPYPEITGYDYNGPDKLPAPYPFYSEIYCQIYHIDLCEQTRRAIARLTDKEIYNYFTHIQSENQLFSTIFGYVNDLSDKQIAQIANLRHRKMCWDILNFFLVNRDAEQYQPELPLRPIKYFVTKDGRDYEAQREGNKLTLRESGQALEIL